MKKTAVTVLTLVMAASLAGCSGSPSPEITTANAPADTAAVAGAGTGPKQGGDKLVVYLPNSEGLMNATTLLPEEKYGVDAGVVQTGTGKLIKRIQSEKEDPHADTLFGGSQSLIYDNKGLWGPYVSVNDDGVVDAYRNIHGLTTGNVLDESCLIVNIDLIGDIKIDSYAGLLNPGLEDKIATYDPTNPSSAFTQLTDILLAMGGYEDDGAWKSVEDPPTNIDDRTCKSSFVAYKGVADDECVVGLPYEDPYVQLARDGAPIKVVYLTEGAVYLPASATIIKGAKSMDDTKLFMDSIMSEEVQNIWETTLTNRPVLKDAKTSDFMTPMSEIHVIEEDTPYVSEHRKDLVNKYMDIFADTESSKQSTNSYGNCSTAATPVIKRLGG